MGARDAAMTHLFCYGFGYTARSLARRLRESGDWRVTGTTRTTDRTAAVKEAHCDELIALDAQNAAERISESLQAATHVVVSAAPGADGDPMMRQHANALANAHNVSWVGYLSTIGVYGDQANAWVDEDTPCNAESERAVRRLDAERAWLNWGQTTGRRVQVFRLAGIYGPNRSVLAKLRAGTARRIEKPGQVFNRIHVDDIALVLAAAMSGKGTRHIYNVTDDEPAPPQDVVTFGAELLNIAPPPLVPYDEANLSPMGRSFYAERRRVRNDLIKSDLGITLAYPTYRDGLAALLQSANDAVAK